MLPSFLRITVAGAAYHFDKAPGTIHCWGTRYKARRLTVRGRVYYDLNDLAVIDRELRHGHKIPATPEARAEISGRCPLRAAERLATEAA